MTASQTLLQLFSLHPLWLLFSVCVKRTTWSFELLYFEKTWLNISCADWTWPQCTWREGRREGGREGGHFTGGRMRIHNLIMQLHNRWTADLKGTGHTLGRLLHGSQLWYVTTPVILCLKLAIPQWTSPIHTEGLMFVGARGAAAPRPPPTPTHTQCLWP